MLRRIGGVAAGAVTGFLTIWLVEMIGHLFYPLPSDISLGNSEDMAALLRAMPLGAQAFVVVAWLLGALAGGVVAYRITGLRWAAWAMAAFVALAAIVNILMIPHPEWMQVGSLVAPLIGGFIAVHLGRPRGTHAAI
jgi:hypothetical protein